MIDSTLMSIILRVIVGGAMMFANRSLYHLYAQDFLHKSPWQILHYVIFFILMCFFRPLSLIQLGKEIVRDLYRVWKRR